jgi:hypothetical protein
VAVVAAQSGAVLAFQPQCHWVGQRPQVRVSSRYAWMAASARHLRSAALYPRNLRCAAPLLRGSVIGLAPEWENTVCDTAGAGLAGYCAGHLPSVAHAACAQHGHARHVEEGRRHCRCGH